MIALVVALGFAALVLLAISGAFGAWTWFLVLAGFVVAMVASES